MKTLDAKKVNRNVRRLNRQLRADVFGTRFEARQYKKSKGVDGIEYFMYILIDNEQPERNKICPFWCVDCCVRFAINELAREMNNFIVLSDFWEKHNAKNGEN